MSQKIMRALVDESMRDLSRWVENLRRAARRTDEALRAILDDEDDDQDLLDAFTDAEAAARSGCEELARLQGIHFGYAAASEREDA